mgnify:FL=1
MKKSFSPKLTAPQLILLAFLSLIIIGSLLLWLPISSADGKSVSFTDAFFTASTSVCVTGLVTLPTVSAWSVFGKVVILLLIQIGGLGVITVMAELMILVHRKIGIADRMLIQDSFNLNTTSGIVKFTKKVVFGTLAVESVGALLYMTVFVPDFGIKGVWYSVFNSVSAFCNAGIDIISENSLCGYALNPIINIVTCLLIILGGIGYIVWWDVVRVIKKRTKQKIKLWSSLTLHSKIALFTTAVLIVTGAVCFYIFEYGNPETMKGLPVRDRILLSLFQSVTTRTAGFATVPQQNLTVSSSVLSLLLMFIGGSPVGTAGGIKTVTFAVLAASAVSVIKNKNDVNMFGRRISISAVRKASAVAAVSFMIAFLSSLLLSCVTNAPALDIFYETVSASATVGLSRNLTSSLNTAGKFIIAFTMYLGRVGPISLAIAITGKTKNENIVKNPFEEISIG